MTLTIHSATEQDIPSINALLKASKASWGYDDGFITAYMKRFCVTVDYLTSRAVSLVYLNENLLAFFSFLLHDDQSLELERMYLDPQFFGQGYGYIVWQRCCDFAKQAGKAEFILWSDPYAQDFYRKMGCVQIGVRESPLQPNRFPPVFKYTL